MNKYLAKIDAWNKATIEARLNQISTRFLQIWQYPPIEVSNIIENEEVNIFEAEDPKDKKLDYAIFREEKIEVASMADFYVEIMKRLFIINPVILLSPELKYLKITTNKNINNRRTQKNINSSYFIETNNNSSVKFYNIKKALELYGLEDELFIKYQD